MFRSRLRATVGHVRGELVDALEADSPPADVAASFAFGVFVTALPTLGVGVAVLAVVGYLVDRISTLALFASVAVLNPVAKWGVYAVSIWLGVLLLGPVPGATIVDPSITAGPAIAVRLLAGNLLLAVVFAAAGYAIALVFARRFCRNDGTSVSVAGGGQSDPRSPEQRRSPGD